MFYLEFALIGHIIHADKWEFCFGHDVCQSITYMKCERFWSSETHYLPFKVPRCCSRCSFQAKWL